MEAQELRNLVYLLQQDIVILAIQRTFNGVVQGSLEDLGRKFVKATAVPPAVGALVSVPAFMNANIVVGIIPASTAKNTATTVPALF